MTVITPTLLMMTFKTHVNKVYLQRVSHTSLGVDSQVDGNTYPLLSPNSPYTNCLSIHVFLTHASNEENTRPGRTIQTY